MGMRTMHAGWSLKSYSKKECEPAGKCTEMGDTLNGLG